MTTTRNRKAHFAILVALSALALGTLPSVVPAAEASSWIWGGGFRIGDISFTIGHRPHHHSDYFYRTTHRIPSRYKCTDRCYIDRSRYYHHERCPVVLGHFRSFGFDVGHVFWSYAPGRYDGYRYDRYDRYDRDYRYDRYDRRYDRYDRRYDRYDRRYDRRDRYDRRHRDRHRDDRYDRRHRDRHRDDWRDRRGHRRHHHDD